MAAILRHLGLGAESRHLLLDRASHRVERRAPEERRRELDPHVLAVDSHVAHDAVVGSGCALSNAVQLAGHSVVGDGVTFGGLSGLAQFVRVGEAAFVAAGAMCERDVPPFVIVQGDRARVRALNVVGLRRRGVPEGSITRLEQAFRVLFGGRRPRAEALRGLDPVAYVRFASVYRDFQHLTQFQELLELLKPGAKRPEKRKRK